MLINDIGRQFLFVLMLINDIGRQFYKRNLEIKYTGTQHNQ
jgi:hypothetical protein